LFESIHHGGIKVLLEAAKAAKAALLQMAKAHTDTEKTYKLKI
jgi:glycerol-3-phosphate cytidylyltransferase-like family protein